MAPSNAAPTVHQSISWTFTSSGSGPTVSSSTTQTNRAGGGRVLQDGLDTSTTTTTNTWEDSAVYEDTSFLYPWRIQDNGFSVGFDVEQMCTEYCETIPGNPNRQVGRAVGTLEVPVGFYGQFFLFAPIVVNEGGHVKVEITGGTDDAAAVTQQDCPVSLGEDTFIDSSSVSNLVLGLNGGEVFQLSLPDDLIPSCGSNNGNILGSRVPLLHSLLNIFDSGRSISPNEIFYSLSAGTWNIAIDIDTADGWVHSGFVDFKMLLYPITACTTDGAAPEYNATTAAARLFGSQYRCEYPLPDVIDGGYDELPIVDISDLIPTGGSGGGGGIYIGGSVSSNGGGSSLGGQALAQLAGYAVPGPNPRTGALSKVNTRSFSSHHVPATLPRQPSKLKPS